MQIISGAAVNGAVTHCLRLSRELAQRGHDVTVVCRPGAWIGRKLAADPVTVVESDLHRWLPDERRRIGRMIRERNIAIVHTHMTRAHAFAVWLRLFHGVAPIVATAHSRHWQLHWIFQHFVIAPSAATATYHRRFNRVAPQRLAVVHNFVDPGRPPLTNVEGRARVRRELRIDDRTVLIGVIGDVIPRKGIDVLVAALPHVLRDAPHVHVVSVGRERSGLAARVRKSAERLRVTQHLTWLGHRDDIPDILAALDILALPSREEQLPMSVLEAMAAGLPIVATKVGGVPECVSDGETGGLVPAEDPAALTECLRKLALDPDLRSRWGQAGRRRIEEQFSSASQVEKIEAAYARAQAMSRNT